MDVHHGYHGKNTDASIVLIWICVEVVTGVVKDQLGT